MKEKKTSITNAIAFAVIGTTLIFMSIFLLYVAGKDPDIIRAAKSSGLTAAIMQTMGVLYVITQVIIAWKVTR